MPAEALREGLLLLKDKTWGEKPEPGEPRQTLAAGFAGGCPAGTAVFSLILKVNTGKQADQGAQGLGRAGCSPSFPPSLRPARPPPGLAFPHGVRRDAAASRHLPPLPPWAARERG